MGRDLDVERSRYRDRRSPSPARRPRSRSKERRQRGDDWSERERKRPRDEDRASRGPRSGVGVDTYERRSGRGGSSGGHSRGGDGGGRRQERSPEEERKRYRRTSYRHSPDIDEGSSDADRRRHRTRVDPARARRKSRADNSPVGRQEDGRREDDRRREESRRREEGRRWNGSERREEGRRQEGRRPDDDERDWGRRRDNIERREEDKPREAGRRRDNDERRQYEQNEPSQRKDAESARDLERPRYGDDVERSPRHSGDDEPKEARKTAPNKTEHDALEAAAKPNASDTFIWKKKNEKLKKEGKDPEMDPHMLERKKRELQEELHKAKERRQEREQERAEWEEEQARLAREKEAEENEDWEHREEAFHATNFYMKQAVRLREHRPSPADFLARNSRLDLDDVPPDSNKPYATVDKVTKERLEEMVAHVEQELRFIPLFEIECDGLEGESWGEELRQEYWECVKTIVLATVREQERGDKSANGVHHSVISDVKDLLEQKDAPQLREMREQVRETLQTGGDIDVEYWEGIYERLEFYLARARVDALNVAFVEYKTKRGHGVQTGSNKDEPEEVTNEDEMLTGEAKKGMGENEEKFSEEVKIDRSYEWNDKYKPRKPKYFNRVHTGYEWNKYNQTHYDHDNPPPKTVQGYKFNVFYPDLIDKSRAPTFKIQKTDNPDVCIIRFIAGPPYEDVAFKIVNREWEHSHKKGFRCTFERGILHLWVNFKRMRYRR